jgi:hypothetical protein
MMMQKVNIGLGLALFLVGCSVASHPESNIVGRWQSDAESKKSAWRATAFQFEFFSDGNLAYSERINGKWQQSAAGTFKFVDKSHVRIDLSPAWYYGTTIDEVSWPDKDHLSLRAGDKITNLARLK